VRFQRERQEPSSMAPARGRCAAVRLRHGLRKLCRWRSPVAALLQHGRAAVSSFAAAAFLRWRAQGFRRHACSPCTAALEECPTE